MYPTSTPKQLIDFACGRVKDINYLAEPQEVRARAFEELNKRK